MSLNHNDEFLKFALVMKIKAIRHFFLAACILTVASAFSQQAYNIQFKIDGWKDTTAYLGHYYGESTYLKDTARVNAKGEFSFTGKKTLDHGVYFLVLDKTKIFEIVVGPNQNFKMETNTSDYIKNMKVSGDVDNKLFVENMLFNMERHKEAEPYVKVLQDSTLKEEQKKSAREAFTKINDKVLAYQNDVIAKHPETITALIFKANQAVKIPDPPKKADGSIDSTFQLRWYREHFFDNFDLANDALIRMPRPIYSEKINEYLDKLFPPDADSLTAAIVKVVNKAKKNKETYKYSVWTALLKYQQPEIMGLDEVYVNLYDKYFASGEMKFWVNDKLMKNLKDYADRLRKSLIGNTAPNLIMQDLNFQPRSMYDIKHRYTILYIFDPDCGHCKEETPKLVEFYNKNKTKFDVEVFAVSADTSMAKMKTFINDMKMKWITVNGPRTYVGPYSDHYDAITTPSLFVIDNKKKIIAKKVPAEKLEDFFTKYEKFHKPAESDKLKPKLSPKP
jgi:peroxiredoxin